MPTRMRASPTRARKSGERRRDRGRVVREIVVDAHAVDFADELHASRDAAGNRRAPATRAATSTPAACAAASAASAFMTLWRPVRFQRAVPISRPRCETTNAEPSASSSRARQSPASMPKLDTGVHAPIASTSARRASSALTTSAPLPRHDAHEMMELALDRRDIGKDIRVIVFEVVEDRDASAGSARTSSACRRTRCRIRRLR